MESLIQSDPGRPDYCARCAGPTRPQERGGRIRPVCSVCGWVYYAKPALGAAVAIEGEDRILLVQRKHDPYRNWWMLPAGFVEYGEFAQDTAVREALEEVGLVVSLRGLRGLYFGVDDPRNVAHLAVYSAVVVGGELRPGDDAQAAEFFPADDLPERIAFQGHRDALADWVRDQRDGRPAPEAKRLVGFRAAGPAAPLLVYVVVENPRGSHQRMVYDFGSGRFLPTDEVFPAPLPFHYGFVPATLCAADGDPVDAVLFRGPPLSAGAVMVARPVGLLLHPQGDHKILAVPAEGEPETVGIGEVFEMPEDLAQAKHWLTLIRPGLDWGGPVEAARARQFITEGQALWARQASEASRPTRNPETD